MQAVSIPNLNISLNVKSTNSIPLASCTFLEDEDYCYGFDQNGHQIAKVKKEFLIHRVNKSFDRHATVQKRQDKDKIVKAPALKEIPNERIMDISKTVKLRNGSNKAIDSIHDLQVDAVVDQDKFSNIATAQDLKEWLWALQANSALQLRSMNTQQSNKSSLFLSESESSESSIHPDEFYSRKESFNFINESRPKSQDCSRDFLQNCSHPYIIERSESMDDDINKQIINLRQENILLTTELTQIKQLFDQFERKCLAQPQFSSQDVRTLVDQNNRLSAMLQALESQINNKAKNEEQQQTIPITLMTIDEEERENCEDTNSCHQQQETARISCHQATCDSLNRKLKYQTEENSRLAMVFQAAKEQIHRLRTENELLEQTCDDLQFEKERLAHQLQKQDWGSEQLQMVPRNAVQIQLQAKQSKILELTDEKSGLLKNISMLTEDNNNLKKYYHEQVEINPEWSYQSEIMMIDSLPKLNMNICDNLQERIDEADIKSQILQMDMDQRQCLQSSTSHESTDSRINLIQSERCKEIMIQIKRLLNGFSHVLKSKLMALVHEICQDVDTLERESFEMRDIIDTLENQLNSQQNRSSFDKRSEIMENSCEEMSVMQLQQCLQQYQQLLCNADQQMARLQQEVFSLRLELSQGRVDSETEQLIQQLTLQLQSQKYARKSVMEGNDNLKNELLRMERELCEKKNEIKLLELAFVGTGCPFIYSQVQLR